MPIRAVMIDDDADFLWLIRFSLQLEHDITVIGEADEGETEDQFLHLVPRAPPGYCRACVRDIQQPAVRRHDL
jgi:DNA-binding NarL/FixJ family response regulator